MRREFALPQSRIDVETVFTSPQLSNRKEALHLLAYVFVLSDLREAANGSNDDELLKQMEKISERDKFRVGIRLAQCEARWSVIKGS